MHSEIPQIMIASQSSPTCTITGKTGKKLTPDFKIINIPLNNDKLLQQDNITGYLLRHSILRN